MVFKSVLILAFIGLLCSANSHCCETDEGRDCSCADRAFSECLEPPPSSTKIHVLDFEQCWMNCHLLPAIPYCDWFLFNASGKWDENCELFFGPEESMVDYLSTCNLVGMPTRLADDTCIADPSAGGFPSKSLGLCHCISITDPFEGGFLWSICESTSVFF